MGETQVIRNVTAVVGEELEPKLVDVGIDGGTITRIDPVGGGPAPPGPARELDGTGLLAAPGFVDAHDHLRDLTPGFPAEEGVPLDQLLVALASVQQELGPDEYRAAALMNGLRRLRLGVTTLVDHCYPYHQPGLDEASLAAYQETGLRWFYGRGVLTRPNPQLSEPWPAAKERIRGLLDDGLVPADRLVIAPVSLRQATPADLAACAELAAETGARLHLHVAETPQEDELWRSECGAAPIRALDQLGFLGPNTHLVHAIYIQPGDVELLAERGVHVIDCPSAHLDSGKSFTRVDELLAAGVNVGFGVDRLGEPLLDVRLVAGLSNGRISTRDAFSLATRGGARALGIGSSVGTISVGMAADIVLFEPRTTHSGPVAEPWYSLVHASSSAVKHVYVAGELVLRDQRSTLVDEDALREEVAFLLAALLPKVGQPPLAVLAH